MVNARVFMDWASARFAGQRDSREGGAPTPSAPAGPLEGRGRRLRRCAIALELVLAIGAIGGGAALMAGPHGEILPLPVSALSGSIFASYFAPGAILFGLLGLGPLIAALLAWRRNAFAPAAALLVGGALLVWIVVEIGIIGYSNEPPLQALYLGLGAVITLVAAGWWREARR